MRFHELLARAHKLQALRDSLKAFGDTQAPRMPVTVSDAIWASVAELDGAIRSLDSALGEAARDLPRDEAG